MSENTCLQNRLDAVDKQIRLSKLNTINCSGTEDANKALMEENERLKKQLLDAKQLNNDGLLITESSPVSLFPIIVIYIILISIIGIFYNNLITKSIIEIMNKNNVTLSNYYELDYSDKWNEINHCLSQYRFILFIVFFIVIFIVNVFIVYTLILKGTQLNNAMKVVSICIPAIVGTTFILVNNVNFVKIFENTIGFALAKLFSPKKDTSFSIFISNLFKHEKFPLGGISFDFLFSVFRLDNFGDILKDIGTKSNGKYDFHLNSPSDSDLNSFASMVVMKNSIGHLCWVFFSTIACTMVSIKYLAKKL
jgi:hypothetical protein